MYYDGVSITPYETVFVPVSLGYAQNAWSFVKTAAKYEEWMAAKVRICFAITFVHACDIFSNPEEAIADASGSQLCSQQPTAVLIVRLDSLFIYAGRWKAQGQPKCMGF